MVTSCSFLSIEIQEKKKLIGSEIMNFAKSERFNIIKVNFDLCIQY